MSNEHNDQGIPISAIPTTTGDELETPEDIARFRELLSKAPRQAMAFQNSGMSRRRFLQLAGASLALSGFTLAGCSPSPPPEQIIPYARVPEEIIPGRPLFFASAMALAGYSTGLLIETHQGRPTRIEGNPLHTASRGALNAITQAAILDLYNPERSLVVRNDGVESTWDEFTAAVEGLNLGSGAGLRILTDTIGSPTLASQIETLLETYPEAQVVQHDPAGYDSAVGGALLAFDKAVETVYNFAEADVVLSLDANFLADLPGSVAYARDFMSKRKVRGDATTMNRLYVLESTPTITGATADNKLSVRASQVESFARALAGELGIEVDQNVGNTAWSDMWFSVVLEELRQSGGRSIVVAGPNQPAVVHALVHAINAELGNVGTTVFYTDPVLPFPVVQAEAFSQLVEDMNAGNVDALFMLGGDPVYTAPADLGFREALENVAFKAHLSLYLNDTSVQSNWHIPAAHFVETWSDGRGYDGTASITQPPIGPLYDTVRSAHQIIGLLTGETASTYDLVRAYWEGEYSGGDFEAYWRRAIHDGVVPESTFEPIPNSLRADFAAALAEVEPQEVSGGLELIFRADPAIFDGRFSYNSWLQELPDPITKITWDNAALLSPATAEELGISREDVIELQLDGRTMQASAWIMRGHPDDAVTISLGYGQRFGPDEDSGFNFNAYSLRSSDALWFRGGLQVSNTGNSYDLATARWHDEMDDTNPIRNGTIEEFVANPTFVLDEETDPVVSLLPEWEYEGYAWGMSIDLTSCIGCNACIIGCQMENNIPVVGKEGVSAAREMSWIRIDRYYVEDEAGDMQTQFQPVNCMHCENAPCELVCPVEATIHDSEGLNNMVYNRCIGTRYCSANCPYGVRRFNFFQYTDEAPVMREWRNPNVSVRPEGVMEKCTYCIQRINAARIEAGRENRTIQDGDVVPACAAACPTQAILFGDINDSGAAVVAAKAQPHNYGLLDSELNTKPRTTYLARITNPNAALVGSGSGEEE